MTTAKDVLNAIFARHTGPEWVNFAEVSDSTGSHRRRRADAICMNIWPSKGFAIHGYEIKVSRADFIQEMRDITKAAAVSKYCDFWWLAIPAGMVSVEEVPSAWGLMELHKNGLKIKKQAPQKNDPEAMTRGFIASLLRDSRKADDAYIQSQIEKGEAAREAEFERQLERRHSSLSKQAKSNSEWIDAFEEKLGIPFKSYEPPEAMAERLRVAESLQFGNVSRLMQVCAHVVKEIGDLGKSMPNGRDQNS